MLDKMDYRMSPKFPIPYVVSDPGYRRIDNEVCFALSSIL